MTNEIKAGQILKARSACDHDCIFSVQIIDRKGKFATVKAQGITKRIKIMVDDAGEYIYGLGKFSMAPIFRANQMQEVAS